MSPQVELIGAAAYVLLGRWLVGRRAAVPFAMLNLAAVYFFFFWGKDDRFKLLFSLAFGAYVALVSGQYLALCAWGRRQDKTAWLAFFSPIAILAAIRYVPLDEIVGPFHSVGAVLRRHPEFTLSSVFIGFSYLAFRTSRLVLEVRNGVTPPPGYWEYMGFAFFAPTLSVGPINSYSLHRRGFLESDRPRIPIGRSLMRVLVGAVKFRFLGPLLNQLTYSGLLLDGHPHNRVDLPVAAVSYYIYLFCNFSGFCDIAIGAAGLMGIEVAENFANPFASRNVKDFWNRWHITLSLYMRDIVFSPLSKALVRAFGPSQANQAIAVTILVVFLLIGVWHGVGWNYAAFGVSQGLGVVWDLYYTNALKKRLGRERFAAYNRSPAIHVAAVTLTFLYISASLFFFANDGKAMKTIFSALRTH